MCNDYPAGIWCENDVVLTSMRCDYIASTLIRRHFDTKCPLGTMSVHQVGNQTHLTLLAEYIKTTGGGI